MPATSSELRHSIRGTLNALKLCVSALDMPMETSEKLEFLTDVETAAGQLSTLLDDFEAASDAIHPAPSPDAAVQVL